MEIVKIEENNISEASKIYPENWKELNKGFCTDEFIARHTTEAQNEYVWSKVAKGKDFYMLVANKPVGVVSLQNSLIENLYVLSTEYRKCYGTMLLQYVLQQCNDIPSLLILSNNESANAFYRKYGFTESSKKKYTKNCRSIRN